MRRPSAAAAAAAAAALRDARLGYLAFYRGNWLEGKLSICDEAAVKGPLRRLLAAGCPAAGGPRRRFDLRGVAEGCLRRRGERGGGGGGGGGGGLVLRRLLKALEFLELLCVNLFLSPWRKEIRSLKTFTGNFVYYVQSVLPEGVVERLLEEIGYVATTVTEFSLVRKLNEEEAEQAAFELFLARIECEDLLEIAEDVRDSDLGDLLQKRAQKHWCSGRDLDTEQQPIQRTDYVFGRGEGEAQGCHCPQETYLPHSTLAVDGAENTELKSEVGLRCPAEGLQTAISKCFPEQSMNQRSMLSASSNSCTKSSDSEDFLIKYSDIVIRQKPLYLTDLPPKALANETQAMGFNETRLGPPASGAPSFTLLSPDASGPQALAILNNGTLGDDHLYDYRTKDSCKDTVESKVCDAMNCLSIHGSDPTGQPKELKGNTVQHSHIHMGCNFSREEETCNLFPNKKVRIKEDCAGRLMCPVEEMAQVEQRTSKSNIQEFDLSRTKLANLPDGNRGGFNIDLYSSPDLFCNITGCECPAVDSTYNRLVAGIPGASEVGEYLEQPRSPCTVTPEVPYHGGLLPCMREGCPLRSSFADFSTCLIPVSETNPEGYGVINKDN